MSVPAAYSELTLAQYMHAELGPVAKVLEYPEPAEEPGIYREAVNEVLLSAGVSDISQIADIRKVRALARREAWAMAVKALSTYYNFSADGARYDQSQMHAQAKAALDQAIGDCLALGLEGYTVSIQSLDYRHDPYSFPKEV
ncbi:MAG: hypothetical protein QMD04_08705 [Anaerolineales bacterium]|nr:hypothetical protein [Anaerolineales bacterium]